jgi:hypothetical protein
MKVAQPLSSSGNLRGARRDRRPTRHGDGAPRVTLAPTLNREVVRPIAVRVPEKPPERLEPPQKLTKLQTTKIVGLRAPSSDPKVVERERLVAALLAAQSRRAITQVTQALLDAGHEIPDTQEAHLQLLEHGDEAQVRASIGALTAILTGERQELPKRRPVLEQRLKRLEEFADEVATRDAAAALRRKL